MDDTERGHAANQPSPDDDTDARFARAVSGLSNELSDETCELEYLWSEFTDASEDYDQQLTAAFITPTAENEQALELGIEKVCDQFIGLVEYMLPEEQEFIPAEEINSVICIIAHTTAERNALLDHTTDTKAFTSQDENQIGESALRMLDEWLIEEDYPGFSVAAGDVLEDLLMEQLDILYNLPVAQRQARAAKLRRTLGSIFLSPEED